MLRALARRRAVVLVTVVALALAAFAVPVLASADGHCLGGADQHCGPALLHAAAPPSPAPGARFTTREAGLSPPRVVAPILKIPLIA